MATCIIKNFVFQEIVATVLCFLQLLYEKTFIFLFFLHLNKKYEEEPVILLPEISWTEQKGLATLIPYYEFYVGKCLFLLLTTIYYEC